MSPNPLWAIVPVKRFANAKLRLSASLGRAERERLSRAMLDDLLAALAAVKEIEAVCIVSDEPSLAASVGAGHRLRDPADATLSDAVCHATRYAIEHGAATCCVLHADLPLASPAAIASLLRRHAAGRGRAVTLVSDRRRRGTNVMVCTPGDAITFRYGDDSLEAHRHEAGARGIDARIVHDDALGLDIDTPEDLALLVERCASDSGAREGKTHAVIAGPRTPGGMSA